MGTSIVPLVMHANLPFSLAQWWAAGCCVGFANHEPFMRTVVAWVDAQQVVEAGTKAGHFWWMSGLQLKASITLCDEPGRQLVFIGLVQFIIVPFIGGWICHV